jgi:Zn-dependent protease
MNWGMGALTSLLLFSSVLIHELAHSLVAIQQGEKVGSITLFILGGVAQIGGEPKEPIKEFSMALAGPFTSVVLAVLFWLASFGLHGVSAPLSATAFYLSMINIALAIFNLLPGFPMDGGRVLRSIIWTLTGNLRRATKIASQVGQVFAFMFIFLGILLILRADISGLWLIFIGWFLHSAAVRGYSQVVFESVLKDMKARDLMDSEFETVSESISVQELVDEHILKRRGRVFLVGDGGDVSGIVCLEDVKSLPRAQWATTAVSRVMTPRDRMEFVSPDTDGGRVLKSLTGREIHQVPVMEGGRVVGIIRRTDVLRTLKRHSELEG